jgi:hypothetical protein
MYILLVPPSTDKYIHQKGSDSPVNHQSVHPQSPPFHPLHTPLKSNNAHTSTLLHNPARTTRRIRRIRITRPKAPRLRNLCRAIAEHIARLGRKPILIGVQVCHDSTVHIRKRVLLDVHLRAHARVDARDAAVVAAGVDVRGAEADRGQARVDALEGVVVVGYAELARVFGRVAV